MEKRGSEGFVNLDFRLQILEFRIERMKELMTCKYCILHELGHCRKVNPYLKDKEPRYLRLRTGKTLALTFDCKRCVMIVEDV